MEMTLDQYLAEIDRWKQSVSDRMAALSASERAVAEHEARKWLESKLGQALRAPSPHEPSTVSTASMQAFEDLEGGLPLDSPLVHAREQQAHGRPPNNREPQKGENGNGQ
jgi:hypothetical protein